MTNSFNPSLTNEIRSELLKLQGLKQIVTGKRVSSVSEIISDLLKLKTQLPYYLMGSRIIVGIASHNKDSEGKRKKTNKKKRKK